EGRRPGAPLGAGPPAHPERADRIDERSWLWRGLPVRPRCARRARGAGTSAGVAAWPPVLSPQRARARGRAGPPPRRVAALAAGASTESVVPGTGFASVIARRTVS